MRRTFGFGVLACPRCGWGIRLVPLIEQGSVIQRILAARPAHRDPRAASCASSAEPGGPLRPSALPQLRVTASVAGRQEGMRTRRVMCPLASQKVLLLARKGSSGAGWMLPSMSNARDVILCSPGAGVPQSNVQNLQA